MKFAALSDIHGNVSALNAVLQDIAGQGVDFTVNLGDIVSGGLFPAETAERLLPLNFPTIKGNHERQLLEMSFDKMGLSDQHAFQQLQPAHWEWLRALPAELTLHDEIVMVHGVPGNDTTYLLEEVSASSVMPSSVSRVTDYVKHLDATLILCGHTHIPRLLELNSGCVIVNPGSVGLQAYDDERPFYHKMESGSPHARYALLEKRHGKWAVEFRRVNYDWEAAANAAQRHQRPDWVNALRTGRMG